jgi:hypothetical protein
MIAMVALCIGDMCVVVCTRKTRVVHVYFVIVMVY